ncbi:MAG: glycosyltransferase family 2 protein [Mycobacteriales bacterium]
MAVVIASRNRAARLGRLLDRLDLQTHQADEIVVVDDGSTDGTAALLSARPRVLVSRSEVSTGPAAARNRGISLATSDVIAFTDDDCQPDEHWLARIVAAIDGGADVVLGRTVADEGAWSARGPWDHWMVTEGADPMFSTCNIGYRRGLLETLGGFDEAFRATRGGAQWGEDTDLGLRAVDRGATVVYDEQCVVEHDVVSRNWRAYCVAGLRRQGVAHLVKKHDEYRGHLEHEVFLNQAHAWAPLSLVGLAAGAVLGANMPLVGGLVASLGALPYINFRTRVWPVATRRRSLVYVLPMLWVADLLETFFVVAAALRSRVLVV